MVISLRANGCSDGLYTLCVSDVPALFLDVLNFCFGNYAKADTIEQSSMRTKVHLEQLGVVERELFDKWRRIVGGEAVYFLAADDPIYSMDFYDCSREDLAAMLDELAQFVRIDLSEYPKLWHEIGSAAEDMLNAIKQRIQYDRRNFWFDDDVRELLAAGVWPEDFAEARKFIERYHFPDAEQAHYFVPASLQANLKLMMPYCQDMDYAWRRGLAPLAIIR